jgi:predicted PurR-regulated permease PerM
MSWRDAARPLFGGVLHLSLRFMSETPPPVPDAIPPSAPSRVSPRAASGNGPAGISDVTRTLPRFGARWIALLAVTVITLYLCWLMARPFVEVFLWAGVLVVVFFPVHRRILAKVRSPSIAALLSCVLVGVTILGPLTLVTLAIAREAVHAADNIQAGIDRLLDPDSRLHNYVERWIDLGEIRTGQWKQALVQSVQDKGGTIASASFQIFGRVLGAVLKILFVVLTMYYFFRDGERIKAALHDLLPLEHEQSQQIFQHTHEVISASVNGVVVIAAIQGTLGGIAFAVLRVPSPLMWGAVMFLTSMIPLGGSALVWGPVSLFLLATGHWIKALILALWGALVIGMLDNILRPKLVGNRTRLHELLVLFSVLGGLQVFGPLGLVVGPVVVAITLGLVDVFRQVQRPAAATLPEPSVLEKQDALRDVPPSEQSPEARIAAAKLDATPTT